MTSQFKKLRWLWPQFSLRALLLAMLLLGCVMSWFVSQTRLAMRQQRAIEQIRSLRGHVTFAYQLDPASRALAPPMPPTSLRRFTGNVVMSDVVKVSLHSPHADDGSLAALSDLPKVTDLRLNLRNITDVGIRSVADLKHLRRLDLWCAKITDEAMLHLADFHELHQLDLYSTQVTDKGLEHLRELTHLSELKLRGTNVTKRGVEMLQQALPNCKILGIEN